MNEHDFIRRLRDRVGMRGVPPNLVSGIGDDAAVFDHITNTESVITTDLLVEDVDFILEATPPRLLGHKALAVSLSDIAAMGARPRWSLVSIGLTQEVWNSSFKDEFFDGYFALADRYGVKLIGGDVSRTPERIVMDSIVLGQCASGAAVLRSGTQPGDRIYVTGTLGAAAAGVKLIKMGKRLSKDQEPEVRGQESEPPAVDGPDKKTVPASAVDDAIQHLLLRQLRPSPRVGWGIVLGEEHLATAMIDISDGLSSDLAHLCGESHVGALIQSAKLPIDRDVVEICGRRALDPLMLALHGGEDFELLFTVHPDNAARLPKQVDGVPIADIGEVTSDAGRIRVGERNREWDLEPAGFQHFKR
jgi:thiamine-monophosphate kinase